MSTKLFGQQYGGSDPESLALSPDEKLCFLRTRSPIPSQSSIFRAGIKSVGYIPTEFYPTVVAATSTDLLIASAKGRGSGPNPAPLKKNEGGEPEFPYNPAMTHGSLARIPFADIPANLVAWTAQTSDTNAAQRQLRQNRLRNWRQQNQHVIYIIKENRTYDQLFGDLGGGNGDPSITMYGEAITPNQHKLARQFGVLDNFYDSGDVSGDGHVWSTSASISDYIEKTWPIAYRGKEHTYDSEGELLGGISVEDNLPDAGEPTGGFLWKNFAVHGISYRHYGEYIVTRWCNAAPDADEPPKVRAAQSRGTVCPRALIRKGEPLEKNVGDPRGGPSPYPWAIPVLAKNVAAQPELRGHFDPLFPDFEVAYPDQLRADEFLNEFKSFVDSRNAQHDAMPQFILLRLPNDHTAGGTKGQPKPAASVADNDLASRSRRRCRVPHSLLGRHRDSSSSKTMPRTDPITSTPTAASPWSSANIASRFHNRTDGELHLPSWITLLHHDQHGPHHRSAPRRAADECQRFPRRRDGPAVQRPGRGSPPSPQTFATATTASSTK